MNQTTSKSSFVSKITPINVIIWCCVAMFAVITIVVICKITGIGPNFELTDQQDRILFTMMVTEVTAISVAVFGKFLGISLDRKKAAST